MIAPLDLDTIARLVSGRDFRGIWLDLVRALPRCRECGRVAVFISRPVPQNPPHYACGMLGHPWCEGQNVEGEVWGDAPWKAHVVAARMLGAEGV